MIKLNDDRFFDFVAFQAAILSLFDITRSFVLLSIVVSQFNQLGNVRLKPFLILSVSDEYCTLCLTVDR